jgi:hypothetical protein
MMPRDSAASMNAFSRLGSDGFVVLAMGSQN